jgi:hypothetical protein
MVKHLDEVAPNTGDPARIVVQKLGAAPPELPRAENRVVNLQLVSRQQRLSSAARADQCVPQWLTFVSVCAAAADSFASSGKSGNPLYHQGAQARAVQWLRSADSVGVCLCAQRKACFSPCCASCLLRPSVQTLSTSWR